MIRTRWWTGPDWVGELESPWRELSEASPSATPFQTWEWQTAWMRHLGRTKSPFVWTAHEGDDLVGLMPLVQSGGVWRVLRSMGSGASDYLHPLARAGCERAVAERLREDLRERRDVDLIDLHQIRETEPVAEGWSVGGAGSQRTLEQAVCLVLDLPRSYDEFVSSLGKSLRYDVRRLDKICEGGLKVEDVPADELPEAMHAFFSCHRSRWRSRGLPGAFLGAKARAFHFDWALLASKRGWLRLARLKREGRIVGVIYAMALGDTVYFYQSGFEPAEKAISPGTLLVAHTVRNAIEEGAKRFDFLRGDEPYKRRWKPQHALRNVRILAPAGGILGRLAHGWNSVGFRIESRLRARLEGRGLL